MIIYAEHHLIAALSIANASLQMLNMMPETDAILDLRENMQDLFDIVECLIQARHFGSDQLDCIIQECDKVVEQIDQIKKDK